MANDPVTEKEMSYPVLISFKIQMHPLREGKVGSVVRNSKSFREIGHLTKIKLNILVQEGFQTRISVQFFFLFTDYLKYIFVNGRVCIVKISKKIARFSDFLV